MTMKKGYFGLLIAAVALAGCKDVLNKTDLSAADPSIIFRDSTLATLSLNYVYDQNLPAWGGPTATTSLGGSSYTDESYGESKYLEGSLTVTDVTDFGTALNATNSYGKIRTINSFLQDLKNGTIKGGTRNRLLGQALFFRAWRYFELVKLYGGVPLVLTPQEAVGVEAREAAFLPRNSTSDCYKQIAADLDSAIAYLPAKWSNPAVDWGRITSGAAAALKGRVLLYAASPQFNPNDVTDKWKAAYDAGKQAVAILSANGGALHASFDQMWFQEQSNPEAVFITGYNTSSGDQAKKNNGYDNATRPKYTGTGGGSNQPSWEMVKAFPMLDGKKPGESTKYAYSDSTFFKNRDPRFEKTIAYNGSTWPLNGNAGYRLWTYYVGGKTTESSATNTGFYTRKAINPTLEASQVQYAGTDWIEIRYAEVLLNLAEAAVGIGQLEEAYTQLKAIRKRAGIEAGTDGLYGLKASMTRAELFDAILYERQIEFAFEGKRFWDLRRWKRIEKTLNGKRRTGVTVDLKASVDAGTFLTIRDGLKLEEAYSNYFTITVKNLDTKYAINWKDSYYYFPIPSSAIDNNPKLIQNSAWGGGFDPLQ